jgi:hypothetical protein
MTGILRNGAERSRVAWRRMSHEAVLDDWRSRAVTSDILAQTSEHKHAPVFLNNVRRRITRLT